MKPTYEQQGVIESTANVTRVTAFAGAGKTSTLIALAKAHPTLKMLYIAFNKSVQIEAAAKFPRNVEVRTVNSIAYQYVGKDYEHKLTPGIRPYAIMSALDLSLVVGKNRNTQALYAMRISEAINRYISSDDGHISSDHVQFLSTPMEKNFSVHEAIKVADHIWHIMCDTNNVALGMTHDGYLKLYRNMGGNFNNYDVVLLDEAQDSSPVTIAMFDEAQTRKVLVGDPHQAIYQFRGAVDAMNMLQADEDYVLTNSFRFGDNVAMVANSILHTKGEANLLKGLGSQDSVGMINKNERYAFLARSNSTLFSRAVAALRDRKSIHLIGGTEGYRLDLIQDAYYLKLREKSLIRNPFIRSFDSFESMEDYSTNSQDAEIRMLARVVKDMNKQDIPRLIEGIIASQAPSPHMASIVFSTAHKAKGLEFDNVILDTYFHVTREVSKVDKNGDKLPDDHVSAPVEEVNLAYVAATRAKRRLECPELVKQLIKHKPVIEARIKADKARQAELAEMAALRSEVIEVTPVTMTAATAKVEADIEIKAEAAEKAVVVAVKPKPKRAPADKKIPIAQDRTESVTSSRKKMRRL